MHLLITHVTKVFAQNELIKLKFNGAKQLQFNFKPKFVIKKLFEYHPMRENIGTISSKELVAHEGISNLTLKRAGSRLEERS